MLWNKLSSMCWYGNDYLRSMRRVPRNYRMHNFLICDRDCRKSPLDVFTLAKSRSIEPDSDRTVTLLPLNIGRHFKFVRKAMDDDLIFQRKAPVAVWRGVSTSSCWELNTTPNTSQALNCARANLVKRWATSEYNFVDVGLTEIVQIPDHEKWKYHQFLKPRMSLEDLLKFKYLVSVEGNDVATNLKWALASKSVVLMPKPTRETFILESNLRPWEHYVPVHPNMSDLEEKVKYCEANQHLCKQISDAATAYMKPFSRRDRLFNLGAKTFEEYVRMMWIAGVYDEM